MQPCTCSIRALEIFVKDISGFTLRQSPPRARIIPHQKRRHFGTIPRLTTLETAAATGIKDDFVPFESEIAGGDTLLKKSTRLNTGTQHGKAAQVEQEDDEDEWHAEIEILAPWPHTTKSSSDVDIIATENEQGGLSGSSLETLEDNTFPLDNVTASTKEMSLQELDGRHDHVEPALQMPLLPPESTIESSPVQQRSRAENRQERKLRRLQAGTYRKEAEKRSEQRLAQTQMSSALRNAGTVGGATPSDVVNRQGVNIDKATKSKSEGQGKENIYEKAAVKSSRNKESGKKSKPEATPRPVARGNLQTKSKREGWQIQKEALKSKFGDQGWEPRKRLSPDTLDGIRALHASDPSSYTTQTLADHFKVTPEAIRRILKSKWRPNAEEAEKRLQRWEKRGERKWTAMAAQGVRPPAKWRAKGIKTPQAEKSRSFRRRKNDYGGWEDQPDAHRGPSLSERIL